jgi:hypothetical protein
MKAARIAAEMKQLTLPEREEPCGIHSDSEVNDSENLQKVGLINA